MYKRQEYIQRHVERAGLPGSTVLDLACGTGSLTRELSLRGYEMIGVDLSPDMLAQAAEKNRDAEGIAPIFLCQSCLLYTSALEEAILEDSCQL